MKLRVTEQHVLAWLKRDSCRQWTWAAATR